MHNVTRSLFLGVSVVLFSGCESTQSYNNTVTPPSQRSIVAAEKYDNNSIAFSNSLDCKSGDLKGYKGILEVSSLATIQRFTEVGSVIGGRVFLKGQNCAVLSDAYKTCSLALNVDYCSAGYVKYASDENVRHASIESLASPEELQKLKAKEEEDRLNVQKRKKQEAEFMAMLNDALAREAELKNQLAWTSNALNERKLKLVNINPKSKEYTATNNEIKALEEQLPPLRYIVKLIDDYKVALENDKQQRIAAEQQRQINEQNARQQAYQQQLLDQQRAMQSEAQRQQWWNNLSNTLNRMNGVNCTSTGFGGTVYTNCR